MKLNTNTEWAIIAALILYIAFTPGLAVVRQLLSTGIGKALALGAIIYVWKFVSQPIAILLTISALRCMGMREGMANKNTHCEKNFTLQADNTCRDDKGNLGQPPVVCLSDQDYDEATKTCKPKNPSGPATTPGPTGPTGSTGSTSTMTTMSMATGATGPAEGFVPNGGMREKYASV